MAAPSPYGTSSGLTDAGGVWAYTTGDLYAAVGDIEIIQVLQDGATGGAVALTGVTNSGFIESLAGVANTYTYIGAFNVGSPTAAIQHLWIGRTTGTGNRASPTGTNSTSEDLYIRSYRFTDVSTGTTLATVIENGTAGSTVNEVGTSNTAADAGVTTLGADRLALNFVAVNDDNAIATLTGMTGGTWAHVTGSPYAESSGTDGAIALQAAAMATAGTIDGGTGSIVDSDAWGVVGFALIGTTPSVSQSLLPTHRASNVLLRL